MTEEVHNSASQVENFLTCNRKWFLDSVMRLKQPPKPSAVLGTALHEVAEDWLARGVEPPGDRVVEWVTTDKNGREAAHRKFPGQLFMNGRHLLPAPGSGLIVEGKATWRTPAGHLWRGALDGLEKHRFSFVLDHKTTISPIWALSPAELATNVQGSLYTWLAFDRAAQFAQQLKEVELKWHYYLTDENPNPPKRGYSTLEQRAKWAAWVKDGRRLAWAVNHTHTFESVRPQIDRIDAIATRMKDVRLNVLRPSDVEPNLSGCSAYGGCPHRNTDRCTLTTSQVYTRLQTQADLFSGSAQDSTPAGERQMALSDLANKTAGMQAELAAQNPGAVVPSPVAAPVTPVAAEWSLGDPLNQTQKLVADLNKPVWCVAMQADNPPNDDEVMGWVMAKVPYNEAMARRAALAAAVPPPPVVATPIGVPEAGTINPPVGQGGSAVAFPTPEAMVAGAATPPLPVGGAVEADDEPKDSDGEFEALKAEVNRLGLNPEGKKLRTSGYKALLAKHAGSAPKPVAPGITMVVPIGPEGTQTVRLGGAPRRIGLLLVNTLPRTLKATPFSVLSQRAIERFQREHGLPHYKLVDFGKGVGIFMSYIEQQIVEGGFDAISVDTRSIEGADALSVLERFADEVYRGV